MKRIHFIDFDLIREWANDKNLLDACPKAQMLKLTEEVGELAAAIARGKLAEAEDAIGDIVVVLTILACQLEGLDIEQCIEGTYDTIKERTGKLVDGVFIKDGEK